MTNEEMFERLLNEVKTVVRDEVKGIKEDINELKCDVSGVKNDVSSIKGEIKSIKLRIDNIDERLENVEIQTKENTNKLNEVVKFNRTTALDIVKHIYENLATKEDIRDLSNKVSIINDDLFNQKAIVKGIKESALKL